MLTKGCPVEPFLWNLVFGGSLQDDLEELEGQKIIDTVYVVKSCEENKLSFSSNLDIRRPSIIKLQGNQITMKASVKNV